MTTTFGELKLRSTTPPPLSSSSLPAEHQVGDGGGGGGGGGGGDTTTTSVLSQGGEENLNGFATIDLNGTAASSTNNTNENATTSVDVSYTSFERATATVNSITNPMAATSLSAVHYSTKTSSPHNNHNHIHHQVMSPSTTSSSSFSSSSSASASSPGIMSSASEVSSRLASRTVSTLENLRSWSKSAYKCTRQIVNEKLGKCARTVDPEIESSIEQIRESRRKYENILTLANSMAAHFRDVVHSQRLLAENFAELSQKSAELIDEFTLNCETQRQLVKHGELLLENLNHFTSSLRTLCHKTMEDTLITVRNYESARLEYDAYKADLDALKSAGGDGGDNKLQQHESEVTELRRRYEQLRADVTVKMRFLDENRLAVMRKQLVLFQQALHAYFVGNAAAIEAIVKQFDAAAHQRQLKSTSAVKLQSFLEKN